MDDYHPDHDVKYPDDLPSKSMMAEFEGLLVGAPKNRRYLQRSTAPDGHAMFGQGYGGHQGEGVAVTG